MLRSSALVLALLLASGCGPNCEKTCRKVLDCDLSSERVALTECTEQCQLQDVLYELWEDEEKQDAFDAHKKCLVDSTCAEIEDGECYDERLFVVEPGEPSASEG